MNAPNDNHAPHAMLLDGHGGARQLDRSELDGWRPDTGPLWVRLDIENDNDRAWLESGSGLDAKQRATFLRESAWPRVLVPGREQLYMLLRMLDHSEPHTAPSIEFVHLWVEPARILTMSANPFVEWKHMRHRLEQGDGPRDVGGFVLIMIERMASRLADHVLQFRPTMAEIELEMEHRRAALHRLHRLRRHSIRVQSVADPQRAQLMRLRSLDLGWLTKDRSDEWTSVIDYFDEGARELDIIVHHSRVIEDSYGNRSAEQMNRRIYALTFISALFLPLSLAVGLAGINVGLEGGNILGTAEPAWFIGFCVILVLIACCVFVLFRRRGLG